MDFLLCDIDIFKNTLDYAQQPIQKTPNDNNALFLAAYDKRRFRQISNTQTNEKD